MTATLPDREPPPADDDLVVHLRTVDQPIPLRRRIVSGATIVLFGLIAVVGWGIGAKTGDSAFQLADQGAAVAIPVVRIPGAVGAMLLGAVMIAIGTYQLARGYPRRAMPWVLVVTVLCFVLAFLLWAGTGAAGVPVNLLGLLEVSLTSSIPLILGALAGIVCERTGVINVAIEGQLLLGAFAGALGATVSHNLGVGLVAAMLGGGVIGALLAVFAIKYLVNQVVLGVVLNVLALGLTGFGYDALMANDQETYNNPAVFQPIAIPGLHDIPVIGPVFFDQNLIIYLTYVLVVVVDVGLFRTRWGLRTRAVGEHPKAADTVGIKVLRIRYRNVVLGGLIAGLGGAYLTIGNVGSFTKNISSGQGFIALAAVIFGRWSPRGAIGAALLFGFTDALQTLLSVVGTPVAIPSAFLAMLPYLVTVFAVAGLVGRVQAPAADGEPYRGSA